MDIQGTGKAVQDVACDALIVGVVRTKANQSNESVTLAGTARTVDGLLDGLISQIYTDGEFKGNLGEIATIHTMGKLAAKRVIVVGLGKQATITSQSIRRASAIAARHLQSTGAHQILLAIGKGEELPFDKALAVQAQVEGALLGLYSFRKYQHTDNASSERGITKLLLATGNEQGTSISEAIRRGSTLAEATNFARDLVNEPPNVLTPTELANRAEAMAKQFGLECQVLDRPQMQELGMGGLLAVAQGSAEPPKFIILRYRGGDSSSNKGMALVGKGITFDTGGISIKPAAGMDEMKGDMAGAAAVIGTMQAIASLKPAINVTALVSTTENMPSGTAYRPGDILRIINDGTQYTTFRVDILGAKDSIKGNTVDLIAYSPYIDRCYSP